MWPEISGCSLSLLRRMPNGHRTSYRLDEGLNPPNSQPHTSDSEDTYEDKRTWFKSRRIAHSVLFRWQFLVWRKKRRACIASKSRCIQLAFPKRFPKTVLDHIVPFLWPLPKPFVCTRDQYRNQYWYPCSDQLMNDMFDEHFEGPANE